MIVQIYTMQTVEEAVRIAGLGVNHIGVTPSNHGHPGEITPEKAREIFDAVGSSAVKVALTIDTDLDVILEMVRTVRPDVLHLCGPIEGISPDGIRKLRRSLPKVRIMQAIPMDDHDSLGLALSYQEVSDILLLDSQAPDIGGIGAAGVTHDWNRSAEIVRRTRVPVILAGGLSPDNVADAIRKVKPWGVDSLTHTNVALGGGKFRKDITKVADFVANARSEAR